MSRELEVQGIQVTALAEEFGTPLYVYDGDVLAHQYRELRTRLHPRLEMFFSLKSNPNMAICALLRSLGACAEVSSLAELITARRAGVPAHDIIFPGPGKSSEELSACLDEDIYAIICESLGELAEIDRLARERHIKAQVALRVNPAFSAKGQKLTMSGRSRQFGIDEDQIMATPELGRQFPSVEIIGIHAYMGTRILDGGVIAENTGRILDLAERAADRLGFPLKAVDVGGGLGVSYFDGENDLDIGGLTDSINPVIDRFTARNPDSRLIMELGRYLTAPAGIYIMKVRYIKESMGERFAITDGGTHHHMAAVGIGSYVKRNFPIRLVSRTDATPADPWNIAGPLCTPNDTIGHKVMMPDLRPGDLIGVFRSGAYGPTASPVLFLSHGYPAEVLVHDGRPYLVHERHSAEDLLRGQRIPDFTPVAGNAL
jgi:diaminopimelate decarboxylase